MARSSVKVVCPFSPPERRLTAESFGNWCAKALGVGPATLRRMLEAALEEDHGGGCVTTFATSPEGMAQAFVIAKEKFVLCGQPLMAEVFRLVCGPENVEILSDKNDGDEVQKGEVVLLAQGEAAGLLLAERVCLNLASRLSGVSTLTRKVLVDLQQAAQKKGVPCPTLLETRKTTPGLRLLEKYATRVAGARNHRHGLDGGAMLKENHLRVLGGISAAVAKLKENAPILTKIEVEVSHLQEFEEALALGADVIMLDNFSAEDAKAAVALKKTQGRKVELEVSGNLDRRNPQELVELGVDFLSMGALIHQASWVDMSMQLYPLASHRN
jgi:nicotinate-nucleotide pyrophosphorylase (carboxylating)